MNGQSADDLPIIQEPVALKAVEHEVQNKPVSFLEMYQKEILLVMVAFLLLTVLSVFMALQLVLRRKAEKRAVEREEDMRTLLNSIKEGIIEVDKSGIIREVNPVAADLMGFSVGEANGRQLKDVLEFKAVPTENTTGTPVKASSSGVPSDVLYTVTGWQGQGHGNRPVRRSPLPSF
ncbi:MAG: PAS domain-containing protein [Spirochaetaceae bacterium]|nr:MAG: PAS domain-containing protein [Spirochaetaceae bacterium]